MDSFLDDEFEFEELNVITDATILAALRDNCGPVAGYLENAGYSNENAQGEALDASTVQIEARAIALDEIALMGITFNLDRSDMLCEILRANLLAGIVTIFSTKNLVNLLKSAPQELVDELDSLVLGTVSEDQIIDLFSGIVTAMRDYFMLDNYLMALDNARNFIESGTLFLSHMKGVIKLVNSQDGIRGADPVKTEILVNYLNYRNTHLEKVLAATNQLLDLDTDLNRTVLMQEYVNHDHDLTEADKLSVLATDYDWSKDEEDEHVILTAKVYDDRHHSTNLHHIEYYIANPEEPITANRLAMIIADIYGYCDDHGDLVTKVSVLKSKYDFLQAELFTIDNYVDKLTFDSE